MVQPPEVAHVLGEERDVPTTARSATGTGRLDEEVAHQPAEWVTAARGDGGADRVVVGPRDEGNFTTWALRSRAGIAPMFVQ